MLNCVQKDQICINLNKGYISFHVDFQEDILNLMSYCKCVHLSLPVTFSLCADLQIILTSSSHLGHERKNPGTEV